MPGLHVSGAPSKWFSKGYKYGNSRQTYNREEVEKMKAAVDADMAACGCNPKEFAPSHYTGHYRLTDDEAYGYTYHCQSWSRWYNPETGKMEGHAHCTCDYCF